MLDFNAPISLTRPSRYKQVIYCLELIRHLLFSSGMAHSRAAITTAPNMVMGISIGSAGNSPQSTSMQMDGGGKRESMRNNNSSPSVAPSGGGSNSSHSLNSATTSRQIEDPQTAAQRQAAAKLALRKQLEKTLLQVHHLDSTTSMSNYQINPGND